MEKLRKHYDDRMLIDFILAAKKAPSTEIHAIGLWEELPKYWQMHGKSADQVFKLLNLKNVDEDKLFKSPMWRTWVAFLEKKNGRNSDEMMFLVLMKYYSKEGVKRMIDNAKKSTSTKTIATKLQHELWHNEKKTADDVFKFLKLSYDGGDFLRSPALSTWFSYATYLQVIEGTAIRNAGTYNYGAIAELEKKVGYIELAKMISAEMSRDSNTALKKTVGLLQEQQFKLWMSKGWSPDKFAGKLIPPYDGRDNQLILDYYDFVAKVLKDSRVLP
ncbi:hypothetical protein PHMEG_00034510 [Phytophthora megakarya]|uniref:RxLR effector protein n=1 Tax=Phytophthora megakarya TaxID=4795 RepID=A0A225UQV1_9STRA|nr:hypothetical protein PHMEG_00034510 [Phytophthora megakarya]